MRVEQTTPDVQLETTTLLWLGNDPPPLWPGPVRWLSRRRELPDLDNLGVEYQRLRACGVEVRTAADISPKLRRYARQLRARLGCQTRSQLVEIAQALQLPTLSHLLKNESESVDACLHALPQRLQSHLLVGGSAPGAQEVLAARLIHALEAL